MACCYVNSRSEEWAGLVQAASTSPSLPLYSRCVTSAHPHANGLTARGLTPLRPSLHTNLPSPSIEFSSVILCPLGVM